MMRAIDESGIGGGDCLSICEWPDVEEIQKDPHLGWFFVNLTVLDDLLNAAEMLGQQTPHWFIPIDSFSGLLIKNCIDRGISLPHPVNADRVESAVGDFLVGLRRSSVRAGSFMGRRFEWATLPNHWLGMITNVAAVMRLPVVDATLWMEYFWSCESIASNREAHFARVSMDSAMAFLFACLERSSRDLTWHDAFVFFWKEVKAFREGLLSRAMIAFGRSCWIKRARWIVAGLDSVHFGDGSKTWSEEWSGFLVRYAAVERDPVWLRLCHANGHLVFQAGEIMKNSESLDSFVFDANGWSARCCFSEGFEQEGLRLLEQGVKRRSISRSHLDEYVRRSCATGEWESADRAYRWMSEYAPGPDLAIRITETFRSKPSLLQDFDLGWVAKHRDEYARYVGWIDQDIRRNLCQVGWARRVFYGMLAGNVDQAVSIAQSCPGSLRLRAMLTFHFWYHRGDQLARCLIRDPNELFEEDLPSSLISLAMICCAYYREWLEYMAQYRRSDSVFTAVDHDQDIGMQWLNWSILFARSGFSDIALKLFDSAVETGTVGCQYRLWLESDRVRCGDCPTEVKAHLASIDFGFYVTKQGMKGACHES
jgi:hypothetical protein